MARRRRKVNEDSIRGKNIKSDIYLCFLGLGFFGAQYFYYEDTVISIYTYVFLIIIVGLVTAFFDYKRYVFAYEFKGLWAKIFCFFQNALVWGGIVGFFFLTINYYLADTKLKRNSYEIVNRSYIPSGTAAIGRKGYVRRGENVPIFTIEFDNGVKKDIMIGAISFEEIKLYSSIELTTTEGFFGFDVIKFVSAKK